MKSLVSLALRRCVLPCLVVLLLLAFAGAALAQVQARVDRNPIALGESITLTLENVPGGAQPDLSPLMADFDLIGQSSSESVQIGGGNTRRTSSIELTLAPKRAGNLQIPSLLVGNQRTPALGLSVQPAPPVPSRDGNPDVFLETRVDASAPYVQQSVGVVLTLYYALPLLSGELMLDPPANAVLQKVGEDVQSRRQINGRSYNVVERRFLLVPERSGSLTLAGPRFRGRGPVGWFDNLMGSRRDITAAGPAQTLQVRAQPASAPQPWLPLRDLRLRYAGAPTRARAGEAAMVSIEGVADGATRAQLPELPTPSVPGAQVFPEPLQYDETFVDGRPQLKWTQRFAVVPERAGELVISGMDMAWWDVGEGVAKTARLGDLRLAVAAGQGVAAAGGQGVPGVARALPGNGIEPASTASHAVATVGGMPGNRWAWIAVGFAVLWLLTLLWALRRRSAMAPPATRTPAPSPASEATATPAMLKAALANGSLDDVADAIRQLHAPPLRDLDQVIARLARADQRAALEALRRARWADGDGSAARNALRAAFADGPHWAARPAPDPAPLPPLYPQA